MPKWADPDEVPLGPEPGPPPNQPTVPPVEVSGAGYARTIVESAHFAPLKEGQVLLNIDDVAVLGIRTFPSQLDYQGAKILHTGDVMTINVDVRHGRDVEHLQFELEVLKVVKP